MPPRACAPSQCSSAVPPQPPIPDPLGANLPRRSSLHETPSPPAGAGLANEPSAGLGPGAGGGYVGAEGLELEDGAGISGEGITLGWQTLGRVRHGASSGRGQWRPWLLSRPKD